MQCVHSFVFINGITKKFTCKNQKNTGIVNIKEHYFLYIALIIFSGAGMRNFLMFIIMIFGAFGIQAQSDSLKNLVPDTFNLNAPKHYVELSAHLIMKEGNYELARYIIDEGLKKSKKEHNLWLETRLNYNLADYYYFTQDYKNASRYYKNVLPFFEEEGDTLMIAKTLNSIGLLYSFQNDKENTLKFYLREIELLDEVSNKTPAIQTERIVVLNNIINLYRVAGQYSKVIEFAMPAIEIARNMNDMVRLGSIMNSLAMAYKGLNDYELSLSTFQKALDIFDQQDDEFRKGFIYLNIGGLYNTISENDSSMFYYRKSLKIFEKENYKYGVLKAYTGIADIYVLKKRFEEAKKIYIECVDSASVLETNDILLDSYLALSRLEYDQGNFKNAYDYRLKYSALNDSLNAMEKEHQYAELQTRYETIQKENEINLLRSEKTTREIEMGKNRMMLNVGLVFVTIMIVFLYVLIVLYNQKRQANLLLTEKNKQIESKNIQLSQLNQKMIEVNEQLVTSQNKLTDANNAKDKFFSILGHDLRNPFHSIMGQSYLLSRSYKKLSADERVQYANDIYNSCSQVNRLLDNLLEWIKTQRDTVEFSPREINFRDLVIDSLSILKNNYEEKKLRVENHITTDIWMKADYQMLETTFRNLVNNSIKFTPNGGLVVIKAELENGNIFVSVTDSGVGIAKDDMEKLFKIDSNFKTRGTNNERGTGLGLVICKEFIDYHGGQIWVESKEGVGSVFQFSIPLNC
jgi:signal transduction histidine kinase